MKIDYLEPQEKRNGDNSAYQMQAQIEGWIMHTLEERYQKLIETETEKQIQMFLTMRTYKKNPVFAFGYREEDEAFIVEAWYFHMKPSEDQQSLAWCLDRAPVKELFS